MEPPIHEPNLLSCAPLAAISLNLMLAGVLLARSRFRRSLKPCRRVLPPVTMTEPYKDGRRSTSHMPEDGGEKSMVGNHKLHGVYCQVFFTFFPKTAKEVFFYFFQKCKISFYLNFRRRMSAPKYKIYKNTERTVSFFLYQKAPVPI